MWQRIVVLVAASSVLCAAGVARAAEFVVRPGGDSKVVFTSKAPTETFEGRTTQMTGRLTLEPGAVGDSITVHLEVDAASLDTGRKLRNKHMRDKYVKTKEHPDATLAVPRASIVFPAKGEEKKGTVKGVFTLKGKPKDAVVGYIAKNADGVFTVAGTFDIDVREHDIVVPNYLGVTVDPKMTIRMDFKATDDAP